ncbi:MAG: hypothetical protein KatS3mg098_181 [Candidatus Parcubacteria bacterium]|nr:hypothetical protein [Patescibacteria group bacterium]BCX15952.1 MAG: hypothetical protein KatS3mg098_181 [Candidatus Parcubacteria bacterium]
MVLVFLLKTLYFRILAFFRHWYLDTFRLLWGWLLGRLRALEKNLAIRLNFRFLFVPLYQEYNVYGYVLGFIFRFFRVLMGGLFYLLIFLGVMIVYLFWILIPPFLIYKFFTSEN